MSMITKDIEKNRNKSVLLFSGGMDSLIFSKLIDPDVLLYIPSGSIYEKIETDKIKFMIDSGIIDKQRTVIESNIINLSMFERDDYIVSNRNAFLVLLASLYGERIILSSVSGDRSTDKDTIFYHLIESLLNHMWQKQHWTEERCFKVWSPFKHLTKTELVKIYLEENNYPDDLLTSYSCYSGKEPVCGQCKPCFRKWVSLINNDIKIPECYYIDNPWDSYWLKEIIPLLSTNSYRGKEDNDWSLALKKVGGL